MKKTKLLTSLSALTLLLGLGGCAEAKQTTSEEETEEIYTTTSKDVSEAINLVEEYGAAINSWSTIDGLWNTSVDCYQALSTDSSSYTYLESYSDYYIAQAKTNDDGSLTGLLSWGYTFPSIEYKYARYVDGDNLYTKDNDEINYSKDGSSYTFEDFSSHLTDLIEADDSVIADFRQYSLIDTLSLTGEVMSSNKGNVNVFISIDGDYSGSFYNLYKSDNTLSFSLSLSYNQAKELTSFTYIWYSLYVCENNRVYLENQTITYKPLKEDITTPSWVIEYEG